MAIAIQALGSMRVRSELFLSKAILLIREVCSDFKVPYHIAVTLWGIAKAVAGGPILEGITATFRVLCSRLCSDEVLSAFKWSPQDVSNILWALGTVRHHDPDLLGQLAERSLKQDMMTRFCGQACANTLWGYARLAHYHEKLFSCLVACYINVPKPKHSHTVNILWSLSRARGTTTQVNDIIKLVRSSEHTPMQLSTTMSSLARLKHHAPTLVITLAAEAMSSLPKMDQRTFSSVFNAAVDLAPLCDTLVEEMLMQLSRSQAVISSPMCYAELFGALGKAFSQEHPADSEGEQLALAPSLTHSELRDTPQHRALVQRVLRNRTKRCLETYLIETPRKPSAHGAPSTKISDLISRCMPSQAGSPRSTLVQQIVWYLSDALMLDAHRLLPALQGDALAKILWGLATTRCGKPGVLACVLKPFERPAFVSDLSPRSAALVCWSLAKLKHHNTQVCQTLLGATDSHHLPSVLWACTELRVPVGKQWLETSLAAMHHIHHISNVDAYNLLHALAALRHTSHHITSSLLSRLQDDEFASKLSPAGAMTYVASLKRLSVVIPHDYHRRVLQTKINNAHKYSEGGLPTAFDPHQGGAGA
eukprot:TRINITY_DN6541_c0_g1_i1.p1 TRINITY_DN6541_c0_g1~~TRINITY_DN6541_c0_g1_i1.p1  ORF type:complete len:592 (+),score=94.56 TRINITY_DN6541_c0_g1_i1:428-2203(+)